MHLLWHWFCCFFKWDLCSLQHYCSGGSGMISIYYGQELKFQVYSSRHWLMQQWGFCLFCALKSQYRVSTQQEKQDAPSLLKHIHMCMHITIQYIQVVVCIVLFVSIYVCMCIYTNNVCTIQVKSLVSGSPSYNLHTNSILFGVNHRLLCSTR